MITKKKLITRNGPLEYAKIKWLKYLAILFFIILYAPIINLIIFSFNDSKLNIVWRGFTVKYYFKALHNETLILSFFNSLSIAFISTIISTLIGLSAAICLWKFNFRLKTYYELSLLVPIIIPEICMGVAMLIFFNSVNWPTFTIWPLNLSEIIIAHISFSFPFVVIKRVNCFFTSNFAFIKDLTRLYCIQIYNFSFYKTRFNCVIFISFHTIFR